MAWLGVLAFGLVATFAPGDVADRVPLTITAVHEGTLKPAPHTILTLATMEGYIIQEAIPLADGTVPMKVLPGRYFLTALDGRGPLRIEVQPPSTTITVLVSESGVPKSILPQPQPSKDGLMTPLLWIGFAFVASLVVFLMITSFVPLKEAAYNNLHFLTALCAGFAGGFLTGDALFRWEQQFTGGTKLFLSGTAGFALFFLVWLTYPKKPTTTNPLPNESVKLSIPNGWSFEQAARAITKSSRRTINFGGFDQLQLAIRLPAIDLEAPSS